MPDPHHQAGVAAAAAAGRPVGGSGECQCSSSAGKTHQCHLGAHGRAAGLCFHLGQLHHPLDEDPSSGGRHCPADLAAVHPVEAVGLCGAVAAVQLSCPCLRERLHLGTEQRSWFQCDLRMQRVKYSERQCACSH